MLLADKIEGAIDLALKMVEGGARYHHAARLAQLFKSRGHIDAVAIHIVLQ